MVDFLTEECFHAPASFAWSGTKKGNHGDAHDDVDASQRNGLNQFVQDAIRAPSTELKETPEEHGPSSIIKFSAEFTDEFTFPSKTTSRNSSLANVIKPRCSRCSKNEALSRCAGCKDAPLSDGSRNKGAVYCGQECQKAHWGAHKLECKVHQVNKHIQSLHRAGDVLTKLFYIWREACNDRPIVKVESKNNSLYIYEDFNNAPKLCQGGRIYPLKKQLFEDQETKMAVLTNMSCDKSLAFFHGIIRMFLDGMATSIQEVEVVIKNVIRPIYLIDSARGKFNLQGTHHVLRVQLKGVEAGGLWAVDLTAAQFGWGEIVMPWFDYYHKYCLKVSTVENFGGRRAYFDEVISAPIRALTDLRHMAIWTRVMGDAFNDIVDDILESKLLSPVAFLSVEEAQWAKTEHTLLQRAKKDIRQAAASGDRIFGGESADLVTELNESVENGDGSEVDDATETTRASDIV